MKKLIVISIITLSAAAFASCGREQVDSGETGTEARFSTTITRVTGTSWDNGDRIGITMVANGTTEVQGYQNVAYTTTGNGTFTAAVADRIYFPMDAAQKMDFIAYYPYAADIAGFVYSVDVSNQSLPQSLDLLSARSYGNAPAGYDKNTPNVSLIFRHSLSRLIVVASAGAGIGDLTDMTVSINGVPATASYNISTGEFSAVGAATTITLTNSSGSSQYEGIMIPIPAQDEGQITVDFTVGGLTYTWIAPEGTLLESGQEHIWTIEVARIPVLIEAEIVPWGEGPGGTGEAI